MKKMFLYFIVLISIIGILSVNINVSAYEITPGVVHVRWIDTVPGSTVGLKGVRLVLNIREGGGFMAPCSSRLATAIEEANTRWNNNGGNRVIASKTVLLSANVIAYSYTDTSKPNWVSGGILAFVNFQEQHGFFVYNVEDDDMSYNRCCGTNIKSKFAHIYTTPTFERASYGGTAIGDSGRAEIIVHEIGHVMGLGHATKTTNSIMQPQYPMINSITENRITTPQVHNRNDLNNFYG